MATEAQIRANQENAAKSTGPKTPEGKARSAQNGRIHGLCAQIMLFTSADEEQHFHQRIVEISDQYPFEHALKQTLVFEIASAEFQLQFINRVKRGAAFQLYAATPLSRDTLEETDQAVKATHIMGDVFLRDANANFAMGKFNRYELEQHRILHRAMHDLEALHDKWKTLGNSENEANPIAKQAAANQPVSQAEAQSEPKSEVRREANTRPIAPPQSKKLLLVGKQKGKK